MLLDRLAEQLAAREAADLRRVLRTATSPTAPHQRVRDADGHERTLRMFCSNDYLGLANDPRLAAAWAEGAQTWGVGAGGSHLISGHTAAHVALADALAELLAPVVPQAQALTFSTGYMANLAVLTALGGADTALFCARLNHASLIDGARLARAPVVLFDTPDELAPLLAASRAEVKLIVTDAVFSMDGHLAPLVELLALAQAHDAWLVVDDAHGLGVLGPRGAGSLAHLGLRSQRLLAIGTLGKAMGVAGAFVVAHPLVIQALTQLARPYIYTTAAPPALAYTTEVALGIAAGPDGDARRAHLTRLQARLQAGLTELAQARGWRLAPTDTPIHALIVGDNATALAAAERLAERGFRVPAIRPPTVAEGTARLRITLSATHTEADVDALLEAMA